MIQVSSILFFVCLLIILLYVVFILRSALGFFVYKNHKNKVAEPAGLVAVTLVVAMRNEAQIILQFLEALQKQILQNATLEIYISDDFSEDNSRELVADFIFGAHNQFVWKLIQANEKDNPGKKGALERAIRIAHGELIITTDADCMMQSGWVQSFVDCYCATKAQMITGFVTLNPLSGVLEYLQGIEVIMLSTLGASSVILEKPLMCNGANLAFTKQAFANAGGYSYGGNVPSGDDTFLMLQVAQKGKVVFNKDNRNIILSKPVSSLHQLISQRKRWASKVTFYRENYIKQTGILLVSTNLILVLAVILFICQLWGATQLWCLWLLKTVADFLLMATAVQFTDLKKLILLFLPAALLYPFYSLVLLIASTGKVKYTWKGREFNVSHVKNE